MTFHGFFLSLDEAPFIYDRWLLFIVNLYFKLYSEMEGWNI